MNSSKNSGQAQPQEKGAALPELELDLDGDNDDNAPDWDYNDFAGAKVDGSSAQGQRPKFDINAIGNNSFDDDDDLL